MFCRTVDFTKTLSKLATAITKHPNCKCELRKVSDTHVRYLFRQKNDPDRDLFLAVQAFSIPRSLKE